MCGGCGLLCSGQETACAQSSFHRTPGFPLLFQDEQNVKAKILDSRHESANQVRLRAQATTKIPLWSSRRGLNAEIWVIHVIWVINWSDLLSSGPHRSGQYLRYN